jgi:tripartite ATP-independent transporter DctP family solute receptor
MLSKKLFFIAAGSFLVFFSGCSKTQNGTQSFPVTYTLGDIHKEGYPTVVGAQYFAKLVKERTGGRITIKIESSGAAGEETAAIELVQFGKLDFARVSVSPLTTYSSDLNALMVPFEYRDEEHFWKILNGKIGKDLLESLQDDGFYGLCYYDSGARSFYTTVSVQRIEDLRGLKIRVQESALMMDFVTALGAIPSPMPLGDVLAALKKGTINGAENNIPSYETTGHYRVARYYLLDEHSRIPDIIIASKKTLDKLSVADREIIFQSAQESVEVQRKAWDQYENAAYQKVRKYGCSFISINPSQNNTEVKDALVGVNRRLSPAEQQLVKQIESTK